MSESESASESDFETTPPSETSTPRKPKYLEMLVTALHSKPEASAEPQQRQSVSVMALKKAMVELYHLPTVALRKHFKPNFLEALDAKIIAKTKGVGLIGSVRFHKRFREALREWNEKGPIGTLLEDYLLKNGQPVKTPTEEKEEEKEQEEEEIKEPRGKRKVESAEEPRKKRFRE